MKKITFILIAMFNILSLGSVVCADELVTAITATASSEYSASYTADKAVDGNVSTYWSGVRGAVPWWIELDIEDAQNISRLIITWYSSTYAPENYNIQISSDGVNWEDVYANIAASYYTEGETKVIGRNAKYVRLFINWVRINNSRYPILREIEVYKEVEAPVNQPPAAQASANPASGDAPLTVQFTGSGSDPDGYIASYDWTFGDGGTSTAQNPVYTYDTAGNYTASLIVSDDDGATDSDTVMISVGEEPPSGNVPHLMRFQGNLGDADSQPIEGIFTLTFRIYDAETGGSMLWTEQQDNINIQKGFLDVVLGSDTSLNLAFDKPYWLTVEVENDGEMSPRFMLTTVPYSFTSEK